MSSDNAAAAAGQRRSRRKHRNDSTSSSSHAATPAVAPTVPVLDPLQETAKVVHTLQDIFGGSESELSDLSEAKDDTDDEAPPRAASASPIPPVPSPRRRSPSPLPKVSKAAGKNKGELPASSSAGSRKRKSRRVDSDSGDEELADAEAEPVERKKAPPRKRTPPKAAEDVGASKKKSGNERERAVPRKSRRPADDYKGDDTSRTGDGDKKIITYQNEDGQRTATAKKDEGVNRRIKLNPPRPELQQPPGAGETIEAEPSMKAKARSAKSGLADHQQEQQQSSRKVPDLKEDLREPSDLPGGRGNEPKMAKRKADTEDEREDDRRRQINKDRDRDRAGERGNRDQPRKRQKQDGFDDEEARDSYSDREPKRSKNSKGVRIEASSNESRKRTSAEHASLSANKMSSVSFEKEYGVSTSQERLGAKTPRDGPRDRGGRTPYEGGKTPNERGGKTPKTPYTELEKGGNSSREDEVNRKRTKRREDKQQDMEIDTDDENRASTVLTKPAKRRPTNDISMETPSDLSQSKKSKRDLKQEEDDSDAGRDDSKEVKFSQAKTEDQPKKKRKARTVLPGDSIIDAGSDIEVNLGSTQRVSDKSSSRKKEEIDVDMLDDSEPVVSKAKPQKRPGVGDKTVKRVAELAGTGMGPRTPGEGKAKSGVESAAGVHPRRPGLQPVAKKSTYDPLGSALSSLPGIGPGVSSGNTTPVNRKPQTKQEVVFLAGARDELQQKREALYASQVQLNSMASGLLIQEYEDRPKPWRIRGNIARDDVTGKNTIAAVRAILEMRNNGSFKN